MTIITLNPLRKKASELPNHSYLSALLTSFDHLRTKHLFTPFKTANPDISSYIRQIYKNGYAIINNFISPTDCREYRDEIDFMMEKYSNYIHKGNDDLRIYGIENVSSKMSFFSSNTILRDIASIYNKTETNNAFTLAAKLPYTFGNLGSGGGWHRDSCIKQFKAILYLSDVTEKNGPLQLIDKSNRLTYKLIDARKANQPYMGYRFTSEQIKKILYNNPSRLVSFCAPAGTLILVDTSCIHRGKPIENGCRYTLFNYYYPKTKIDTQLLNQFSPIAQK